MPIYGLYGGSASDLDAGPLHRLLDDDWTYTEDRSAEWKWHHGDVMLSTWYREQGARLEWDILAVMQWDMLALAPLQRIFGTVARDEIYLPGLRPLEDIENRWWWAQPNTPQRDELMRFREMMSNRYGFRGLYQACQFVTGLLPRRFMEEYAQNSEPELGFLEYKLPAMASAMGLKFMELPWLEVVWPMDIAGRSKVTLTAAKHEISDSRIATEYIKPSGARLFHPVSRAFPSTRLGVMAWTARVLARSALGSA